MSIPIEVIKEEMEQSGGISVSLTHGSHGGDSVGLKPENIEFDMENSLIIYERPRTDSRSVYDANAVYKIIHE